MGNVIHIRPFFKKWNCNNICTEIVYWEGKYGHFRQAIVVESNNPEEFYNKSNNEITISSNVDNLPEE